jgi:hypothetical protein
MKKALKMGYAFKVSSPNPGKARAGRSFASQTPGTKRPSPAHGLLHGDISGIEFLSGGYHHTFDIVFVGQYEFFHMEPNPRAIFPDHV